MKHDIAAMRIGRHIQASETGIDTLIGQLAGLMGEMASARVATGSPAAEGHRALARIATAQAKVVEARSDLIRAHEDLRKIAETADIMTDCPENGQLAVADQAAA